MLRLDQVEHYSAHALEHVAILMLYLESQKPGITHGFFRAVGQDRGRYILTTMSSLGSVPKPKIDATVESFLTFLVQKDVLVGGPHTSAKIFADVYGVALQAQPQKRQASFGWINETPRDKLQMIFLASSNVFRAFILQHLDQEATPRFIAQLDTANGSHVLAHLATLQPNFQNKWLKKFEKHLQQTLEAESDEAAPLVGQLEKIARVLERLPLENRQALLSGLALDRPHLMADIQAHMVSFSALIAGSEETLACLLAHVDLRQLATAMQHLAPELRERIVKKLPRKAKGIVKKEGKYTVFPENSPQIEESRLAIVAVARDLESRGVLGPLTAAQATVPIGNHA